MSFILIKIDQSYFVIEERFLPEEGYLRVLYDSKDKEPVEINEEWITPKLFTIVVNCIKENQHKISVDGETYNNIYKIFCFLGYEHIYILMSPISLYSFYKMYFVYKGKNPDGVYETISFQMEDCKKNLITFSYITDKFMIHETVKVSNMNNNIQFETEDIKMVLVKLKAKEMFSFGKKHKNKGIGLFEMTVGDEEYEYDFDIVPREIKHESDGLKYAKVPLD